MELTALRTKGETALLRSEHTQQAGSAAPLLERKGRRRLVGGTAAPTGTTEEVPDAPQTLKSIKDIFQQRS